jgi:uncharacterized membrane protein (DUF373 family)
MSEVSRPAGETRNRPDTQPESFGLFGQVERAAYYGIGVLLSLAAVLALTGAVMLAWEGAIQWPHARSLVALVERLLFVLMIIEILHTVRASIQSHRLASEPFLVVGMIATIRRILVVTLEASDRSTQGEAVGGAASSFDQAMIELAVLGLLTLVLAAAIYLSRHGKA